MFKNVFLVILAFILGFIPFYTFSFIAIIFLRGTHLRGTLEPIGNSTVMYFTYLSSVFLTYILIRNSLKKDTSTPKAF